MTSKRMIHAINDALREEMARDDRVILFGEDVGISIFGDTRGLQQQFGPARVRNTPISEALLTGMAVGAAAAGYRVICHLMYANFLYTGFDAIANQAAKLRFMTGGQVRLPIVYMAVSGGGRSAAAQHSDVPYPALMNLGGMSIVCPATPADAKGLLKTAIRSDDPVVFLQPASRGGELGEVPDEDLTIPLGQAKVVRHGSDITAVAIGAMVRTTIKAALLLADEGIDVEVIDLRTLAPLDRASVLASVGRTGRLAIVDEARDACSAASHVAAIVADEGFAALRAPIRRITVSDLPIPYSPPLEAEMIPSVERICAEARSLCGKPGGRAA